MCLASINGVPPLTTVFRRYSAKTWAMIKKIHLPCWMYYIDPCQRHGLGFKKIPRWRQMLELLLLIECHQFRFQHCRHRGINYTIMPLSHSWCMAWASSFSRTPSTRAF
jgi:hypothetical protein